MPIESPLRRYAYACGALTQACGECDWAQDGHHRELARCPACDAELKRVAIHFGGLLIVKRHGNFDLYTRGGGSVTIEEADVPDAIQFFCRHADDFRRDDWQSPARVRRVDNARHFETLCLEAWVGPG